MKTLLLAFTLAIPLTARADIGPKPSAFFDWKNHAGVDLGSVHLLQCKDAACKESTILQQMGPQRFECCELGCFAMAYGFSAFSKLSAVIEGKEVESMPFEIARPDGYFEVTSGKGRLDVRAVRSMSPEKQSSLQNCK